MADHQILPVAPVKKDKISSMDGKPLTPVINRNADKATLVMIEYHCLSRDWGNPTTKNATDILHIKTTFKE